MLTKWKNFGGATAKKREGGYDQKTASYLHRTATTIYPCCVPTLGDSIGAGRVGLAEPQIYNEQNATSKLPSSKFTKTPKVYQTTYPL